MSAHASTETAAPLEAGRTTTLTRKRVYILPTRHGIGFFTVLLVMLIGSINYNNSLGYCLTFLLVGLGLVAILHTYRNLAELTVTVRAGGPVFAEDIARFSVFLDNRAERERPDICVTYPDRGRDGRPCTSAVHTFVPGHSLHRTDLPLRTTRRGRLRLSRVTVATRFPLGLFRAWSHVEPVADCLVYPRPAGDRTLPVSASQPMREGGRKERGTDDFAGLRRYVPGDSSRRIHWKAVAREQETQVKMFAGTSPAEVRLRWTETPGRDVEERLSQLCRWVLEADLRGHRYALEMPSRILGPASGEPHLRECLRSLALFGEPDG